MLPCESEYWQLGGTDDDEEAADVEDLEQADWVNVFFSTAPLPEEVDPSQLGGTPPATQDSTQGSRHLFLSRLVGPLARPFHQSH